MTTGATLRHPAVRNLVPSGGGSYHAQEFAALHFPIIEHFCSINNACVQSGKRCGIKVGISYVDPRLRTPLVDFPGRNVEGRESRLNEVALPAAAATDASRVVIFKPVVYRVNPRRRPVQRVLGCLEVSDFRLVTLQIP